MSTTSLPITEAQRQVIDRIAYLENYTKAATLALASLAAATVILTALGLSGKTDMRYPVYTLVATPIPIVALKVIEMLEQAQADKIGKELSWCLTVMHDYPFEPSNEDAD